MTERKRSIALLGSTGSIGRSTIEVVEASAGKLQILALSAHQRLQELCEQAKKLCPRYVIATDELAASRFDWSGLPSGTELLVGQSAVSRVVQHDDVDVVVAAIVGSAGLNGTWAAVEAGKTVALANKETLVMAGGPVMRLAAKTDATILPVDSEHSAVFQMLQCSPDAPAVEPAKHRKARTTSVKRIVLTASGGPFRTWTKAQMDAATVTDALTHPTWQMGQKITVDSATMMNKALEIIEARWLFDLAADQIDVVIHPQSIVHSLVEFVDGSVVAQLSPPDMRLPIQLALTWPERWPSPAKQLDLTQSLRLDFEPPDEDRFPAVRLGREIATAGGSAGVVFNAANEAAVAAFLAGSLQFTKIVPACRAVLESHNFVADPTLDELLKLDAWARQETQQWISVCRI
jgi:1-deoxy-D-xylulose-5-phosphate reductoisomerase